MALLDAAARQSAHWRVFQNAATVGLLTSISKVAAAAKVAVTARYFGASDALDAYLIAFLLPNFLVETVAGTFTQSLVPRLIQKDDGESARLARSAMVWISVVMTALAAALGVLAPWVLPWLGASFSADKLWLTRMLMLGMLVWLPMGACSAVWRAQLMARGRMALAVAVQMGTPFITMLLLLSGAARWDVWVLAVAVVFGAAFEFSVLGFAVRRLGHGIRPRWTAWTPELLELRAQYLPLLAGTAITAGCGLMDQAFAAALGSGNVAALTYGVKFTSVVVAVGGIGMATAVLPEFSRLAAQARWSSLGQALRLHLGVATGLLIPLTAVLIWSSPTLVRVFYQRGEFGPEEAAVVTGIQRYSLLQAPVAVALLILQRLVTAVGAAPLVLRAGLAGLVVNLAGDVLLPRWMGLDGVPVASLAGQTVVLLMLAWSIPRRQPGL